MVLIKAYIGYSTALYYWLKPGTPCSADVKTEYKTAITDARRTLSELREVNFDDYGLSPSVARGWPHKSQGTNGYGRSRYAGPVIHVLVPDAGERGTKEGFCRHLWTSRIPDGSFYCLSSDVWVSTPEFAFLQLAGLLTLPQLVYVGYWLCGEYRQREDGVTLRCESATTLNRLKNYVNAAQGCYGTKKARTALRFIADRARSPMEAKMATLVSLPVRLGGWGFGVPELNYQIKAEELESQTLDREDRSFFEVDLYWPRKRAGMEYDGADHYEKSRMRADKRRLNCLTANGYRILVVMYDQIADSGFREVLLHQLAQLLGIQEKELSADEAMRRSELMGDLFEGEFCL